MATNKEKSFSSILGTDGQPLERVQRSDPEHFGTARSSLQAARGYDLLTNQYNGDNWHNAVRLDGNSVNDKETLQRLRDLARGEKRNNPHMAGLIHKVTNETVGTGPRLSIEPVRPSDRSMRAAARVEQLWEASANEMKLFDKLRLMCEERVTAGETFSVVESNRMLTIPVDIRVYEGEQFCSPSFGRFSGEGYQDDVDGIQFDRDGNIRSYTRLDHHPYDSSRFGGDEYRYIDAELVWHWFRKDRPSQYRGVPEVAPMLDVYSRLRRFIESKVKQEELRAKMVGALKTAFAPDAGCADMGDKPIDMMIGDGMFTTLPEGWDVQLFNIDVTGEGVQDFVRTCLSWATQALLVPWNVVAGDSSDYNFASGRLDHILFYNYIKIIRDVIEQEFLNWFFMEHWFPTARLARELPGDLGMFKAVWYWDKQEVIDPAKQANANKTMKESGLLDEVGYWNDRGQNALDVAARNIKFELEKEKIRQELSKQMGIKTPEQQQQEQQQRSGTQRQQELFDREEEDDEAREDV